MDTTQIVGGLNIREVIEGGAEFEVAYDSPIEDNEPDEQECKIALQNYLKLECLDSEETYDGSEPFANISEKMENLTPDGKIKKKILKEGYGEGPQESSTVIIKYNAYIQLQAEPFDSTYARKKPFSFTIGEGEVIEGLEIGVKSMKISEKSQFLIESELAYRSGGLGRIPPDSIVLFEVELCEIQEKLKDNGVDEEKKKFSNVYPICLGLCVKGKNYFRLKNYRSAMKEYSCAVNKLEEAILSDYNEQLQSEELLVRLYTNLLICCTHAEIPKRGCVFAQKIYEMSKNKTFKVSAKVYFNHAKCQKMLGGYDHAYRLLKRAQAVEPTNSEIRKELDALMKTNDGYRNHERALGQALLNA